MNQPREHCGHLSPLTLPSTPRTECVLRPGHSGSHADEVGCRWWPIAEPAAASAVVSPPTDRAAGGSGRAAEAELYVLLRKAGEDRYEAQACIDRYRDEVLRRAELRRLVVEAHGAGAQQPARCPHGCDVTHCPCLACEADDTEQQQPDTEAHPPTIAWKVESPRRDQWANWGPTCDEYALAREWYESATSTAPARPFRLVRATTTYTVEAEHNPPTPVAQQPAAEAWVCKCPAELCGCGHHAPAEQQAAAADDEETRRG